MISNNLRVLLVNDFLTGGGAEGVYRDTYDLLKKNGISVERYHGTQTNTKALNIFSYFYNRRVETELFEKLKAFMPTVIHVHNYYHYLSPSAFHAIRKYRQKHEVKVIMTAHDYHLISPSTGLQFFKYNKPHIIEEKKIRFSYVLTKLIDYRGRKYSFVKKIYWLWSLKLFRITHEIDLIISPSHFLQNLFICSGVSKEIKVIRNPLNLIISSKDLEGKVACTSEVRLIYIGRLSKEKGLGDFLLAFSKISDHLRKNIRLDIYGRGDDEENLKKIVAANNILSVSFHGYKEQEELKKALTYANVLVLPSNWYENAPLSIIEGASYGNIIIANKLGGMIEMAKETKYYFLVANWQEELPKIIKNLKHTPQNEVLHPESFSSDFYVENLLNAYNAL